MVSATMGSEDPYFITHQQKGCNKMDQIKVDTLKHKAEKFE
jgi:hypothetical protein